MTHNTERERSNDRERRVDNDLRSGNPKRLKLGNYYVHGRLIYY
jgi:hypothetical protein